MGTELRATIVARTVALNNPNDDPEKKELALSIRNLF